MKMSKRALLIVLAGATFASSMTAARAGSISVSISQTQIPVGGTVVVTADGWLYPPLGGFGWLESIYPAGSQIFIGADDFATSGLATFSAPGSNEGSGWVNFSCVSFMGCGANRVTFSYSHPGHYHIDYNYSATGIEGLIATVFDETGEQLIAGPFNVPWPPPAYEEGTGRFDILVGRVGGVPEVSTWVMIIFGFLGIGIVGRRPAHIALRQRAVGAELRANDEWNVYQRRCQAPF